MAIKQQGSLTRQDFEDAVGSLRISVAEVAKDTAIPRAYLSELRNHGTPLRHDFAEKLRTYFESKGIEFDSGGAQNDDDVASPHPRLKTTTAPRCYFPIADDVSDAVVAGAMDTMEENDARLAVLLKQTVERDDPIFGDKKLSEETMAALQEAGSLLAENYILFRMLRGWRAFGVRAGGDGIDTLRDVLFETYRKRLEELGLIAPSPPGADDSEQEAA